MSSIWVIGSSNVDMIMQVEHLPNPGETITGGTFKQTLGGKGANAAIAAARSGGEVHFLTCLGDDVHAPVMMDVYGREGLDTRWITREPGISCGTALILIGQDGSNCIGVAPGANDCLLAGMLDPLESELATANRILLQCEIPLETNRRVIELADKHGIPVLLNLAPAMSIGDDYLRRVDTLVVNETEAQFLLMEAGMDPVPDMDLAKALLQLGSRSVIVTLGADGAVLATEDLEEHIPAYKVPVIDTTAAGDTFCGAIGTALTEGKSISEAVRFATAASALSVGRLGAISSIPSRVDIDSFMDAANT